LTFYLDLVLSYNLNELMISSIWLSLNRTIVITTEIRHLGHLFASFIPLSDLHDLWRICST